MHAGINLGASTLYGAGTAAAHMQAVELHANKCKSVFSFPRIRLIFFIWVKPRGREATPGRLHARARGAEGGRARITLTISIH